MTAQTPAINLVAAPNADLILDAPGLKTGLVAGVVVIYLGMVGMIEAFSDRPIITDYINFGPLLILLIFYFFAYAAIGRQADGSTQFRAGITVGAVGGLLTGLFLILVEVGEAAGYQARDVFIFDQPDHARRPFIRVRPLRRDCRPYRDRWR